MRIGEYMESRMAEMEAATISAQNTLASAQEEIEMLKGSIEKISAELDKIGYKLNALDYGVYEVVKAVAQSGEYLDPILWQSGMAVQNGLWYWLNEEEYGIDLPHEAVRDGVPKDFDDREYFDFV